MRVLGSQVCNIAPCTRRPWLYNITARRGAIGERSTPPGETRASCLASMSNRMRSVSGIYGAPSMVRVGIEGRVVV